MSENQVSSELGKKTPAVKAKRKLKPGMGKKKGNAFEGQIAKKLSGALAPLTFIRSPGSGARVGGKNYEAFGKMFGEDAMKLFVADVVATNERDCGLNFKWSIECKSYKSSDSFETMVAGNANIFKWFEESVTDAEKTNREPILVFKWNNTPVYVAVDSNLSDISWSEYLPRLTIGNTKRKLDVFYLDDLLPHKNFWLGDNDGK